MKNWILHYWANVWIAVGLYWLPLGVCLVGYLLRTWRNVRKDLKARATRGNSYYPTDTVGILIGRAVVSVMPIVNLCAVSFDLVPEMAGRFTGWLELVFDQPLVPERKEHRA